MQDYDKYSGFLGSSKITKKSSSDGSSDNNSREQMVHLNDKDKVIRNNLKLNVILQIIQTIIYIVAVAALNWTHITIKDEGGLYNFALLKMYSNDKHISS